MNSTPAIQAINVSHRYFSGSGEITILNKLNLIIQAGECIAITGPSGSGKTTLLSLLAALDTPSEGDILIHNKNVSKLSEDEKATIRRQNISFIFQHFHLLPYLSALDNITLPLELLGVKQSQTIALNWLEKIKLTNRKDHFPSQLSGGEMQRVAIARAFATNPKILFADEPTGNLDTNTADAIVKLLFELNTEHKTTLIIVTHNPALAERCQKQYQLTQGRLT